MIPGEYLLDGEDIPLSPGSTRIEMEILNTGDRPIQVGSHFHLPQSNAALSFDRKAAHGYRLDIPAGTSVRFEPGVRQSLRLVQFGGTREIHGLTVDAPGRLDD
ncbi:urease subunit beta [Mycolicibacterium sp.]|uniref:urease subunit beta n=1 Tax=Mycolicibacterium sp. TaxID=2320850 RepID=UPI0028ACBF22|nr:urease subunit beta [Mycolicibacterium sp.]